MRYSEVKKVIRDELLTHPAGLTWNELKGRLGLPYKTLCPEWTQRLEQEIGLSKSRGAGRALTWTIALPLREIVEHQRPEELECNSTHTE